MIIIRLHSQMVSLLYGIKNSYPILIVFNQIYLTNRCDPKGINISGQSRPANNGNEVVLYTPQSSRTEASLPDAV